MSTSPRQMPPSPNDAETKEDRQQRYDELSRLLDEWANEPQAFDTQVDSLIEQALRETSPRLFPDQ